MKLEYFWADCADGSHVAVNYTAWEGRITGSVRKWSRDTRVNVGRSFSVPPGELGKNAEGDPILVLEGICAGQPLRIPIDPETVRRAEAEAA